MAPNQSLEPKKVFSDNCYKEKGTQISTINTIMIQPKRELTLLKKFGTWLKGQIVFCTQEILIG